MQNRSRNVLRTAIPVFICGLLVFALIIAAVDRPMPGRDAGVFLYAAKGILNGQIPYRDVWDHKGPLIYYLDTLGLILTNGSVLNVWIIEFISIAAALTLVYLLLRRAYGSLPALLASILFFTSFLLILEQGNLTEEFALPFQLAGYYLFFRSIDRGLSVKRSILLGIAIMGCFLLRANLAGIFVAIYLAYGFYLLRVRSSTVLAKLLLSVAVAAGIFLIVLAYFTFHQALNDFIDANFRFNLAYASVPWMRRMSSLIAGLEALAPTGISVIAPAAWIIGSFQFWQHRKQLDNRHLLLLVAIIDMPIELVLVTLSGRPYPHYFLTWLPSFTTLSAYLIWYAIQHLNLPASMVNTPISFSRSSLQRNLSLGVVVLAISLQSIMYVALGVYYIPDYYSKVRARAVDYLTSSTQPGQYVLMWGAETTVNLMANRPSPTRYVYQIPLFLSGYQADSAIKELLDDIVTKKPELIVDASSAEPDVLPLDPVKRRSMIQGDALQQIPDKWNDVFDYIQAHYDPVGTINGTDWFVWRLASGNPKEKSSIIRP